MQAEREGWVAKRLVAAFRGKFRDSGTARVPAQLSFAPRRKHSYFGESVQLPTFPPLLRQNIHALFTSHAATGEQQSTDVKFFQPVTLWAVPLVILFQGVERERSSISRALSALVPSGFVRKYAWN